jgi:hypothetical protein
MRSYPLVMQSILWVSLSWILLQEEVQSFSAVPNAFQSIRTTRRLSLQKNTYITSTPAVVIVPKGMVCFSKLPADDESEFTTPSGETYTGDIDWDGEWKKVVEQRGTKNDVKRPGTYKSEVEIAATKVTRAAQENVLKTVKVVKVIPSWNSLKNDPKFWIGILALISVGLAVLTAPQQGGYYPMSDDGVGGQGGSSGSFYI